ncbi:DUF2171 domain-containing protein [Sphingomonas sp. PAMC 26621]|uniref:DUF2171 domain-containing protein n=1 Tax=Sphingomonas sp. PAMC 26621 TaxID=1112213 RepID=UPI000289CE09|nr:DUF2171 domain-containing protein [Sphingomonas sp. PAMC 26621]
MFTAQQIKPDMNVADSEGRHLGAVDYVEDDFVVLKGEGFADDLHHFVSLAAVRNIDGDGLIVEPGQATTIEAVAGAMRYAQRQAPAATALFGTSGHATADGGGEGLGY